ncbi:TetR family transcriptional regulator [Curtobacterium sp. VKM Ac-2887]|uniref:TetR/AcrR family transcriptional regulator n=1 Tax=Curtobacterium sp. VKM Ac-2887 TaxID=2783819 RepID=UPI00188CE1A4|nr:TetR family transcriptional regulator [Curtobacterium sp. VKM Ac-2887]MBF4585715.1 TetR family transcriptional regulator [Curtobacterium sp. VKM Ac-2887]
MTATTSGPGVRSAAVKQAIHTAATRLFAERGFAMTGVREIAAEAGVNPAIVIRLFGSKEGLFLQSMTLPDEWKAVIDGPLDSLGRRTVRLILESRKSNSGGGAFSALIRASDRPEVQRKFQSTTHEVLAAPLIDRLGTDDAPLRASLFAAQLSGLMLTVWIAEDPAVLAAEIDDVVDLYGPVLQAIVTPSIAES